MLGVQPVANERFSSRRLALGNFVFVMRKGQVDAAGVNVQRLAQIFHGHRGTFNVPAGAAGAERRFPEMLSRLGGLPQRKIPRAFFFVAIVVHPRAVLNSAHIDFREFSVAGKFRDAVIDRAFAGIREGFLLQPLDQFHHIVDMIRRADPMLRRLDAQRLAIVEECSYELLGIIPQTHARGSGIGDNAVIHIGEVHHVVQLESTQLQEAPQNILEHESAVIADVRIAVDRRPAGVHADFARLLRNKGFNLSGQCVVELNFGHFCQTVSFRVRISGRL